MGTFTVTTSPPKISGFPGRGSKESNEDVAEVDAGNNESVPDLWLPSGENRLNLSALGLFRKNADDGTYLSETIHGWKVFCKGSIINDVGLGLVFWLIVLMIDLCCLISGWCGTYSNKKHRVQSKEFKAFFQPYRRASNRFFTKFQLEITQYISPHNKPQNISQPQNERLQLQPEKTKNDWNPKTTWVHLY